MTAKDTAKDKFLSEFEIKYFHDDAKSKINSLAAALEGGIVPTAATATGIRSFGMFAKPAVETDAMKELLEQKKGFKK